MTDSIENPLGKPLESQPLETKTLEAHLPSTTEPQASQPRAQIVRTKESILLEICKDFEVLVYEPKRNMTRRLALRRQANRMPIKKIKRKIAKLRKKYRDDPRFQDRALGFYVEKVKIENRTYWQIGRHEKHKRDLPIFYSTSKGKFYVLAKHAESSRNLLSNAIPYRLSSIDVPYRLAVVRE